jgi:phosphoglucosamine mutase
MAFRYNESPFSRSQGQRVKRLFGTDGIRAVAGEYPLDYATIHALGKALVKLLRGERLEPNILIGRDTRESGVWIERALTGGIRDAGGNPRSAGVIPTSGISYLTRLRAYAAGIVISASHNPYRDNGIKIFSSNGFKLSDDQEARLEPEILSGPKAVKKRPTRIRLIPEDFDEYRKFLKSQFANVILPKKLKVVLDCSNGASFLVAPEVMRSLGFDVICVNDTPNGKNINAGCGSLHPQSLARKVVETGSDLGIAYDGDADRAIWADEKGRVLNGDYTLFVLAKFMKDKGRLKSKTIVATSMSNMGLEAALMTVGLKLVRTKVGDKYVLDKMLETGANLGGEQSGHTIFLDDCPTGDGILTSLKMLEVLTEKNAPLSKLAMDLKEFPQVLVNISVAEKVDFKEVPQIDRLIDEVRRLLKDRGRVEVRYSGTEPLARVMVEGEDLSLIQEYARRIASAIAKNLGTYGKIR